VKIAGLENGFEKPRLLGFFYKKKTKNVKCPKSRFLFFWVKFYTDHI